LRPPASECLCQNNKLLQRKQKQTNKQTCSGSVSKWAELALAPPAQRALLLELALKRAELRLPLEVKPAQATSGKIESRAATAERSHS
jgi:hypothetical protein